ncbi:pyrroline-5-carboxylate reductase [Thermodesulfobacteriota bacterium]
MKREMIGFIGAGNMANALVKGLINSGLYGPSQLSASDKEQEKIQKITRQFGLHGCASNQELVRECPIIVLAVKPQSMEEVLKDICGEIRDHHLLISIAAGIPLNRIQAIIERKIPLIRVMPNTPALVQKGISALAANQEATEEHLHLAKMIFDAVGETLIVEEGMIDAVTALSGSGPGFIFKILECFIKAGEEMGFEREISNRLILQTVLGAAHLAKESEKSLSELREMVTSPGGTTEAGLSVFEQKGLEELIGEAVTAAWKRGIELGKQS